MNYEDFLSAKLRHRVASGFDIEDKKLNKNLFDFQKYIVRNALRYGKAKH